MNLPELIDKLHSEQACRDHLVSVRWPDGVRCPDCGMQSISHIKTRDVFECNNCRRQFSVKSGTIFHDSHLPLRVWFLAIHRIAESKKGVSANQLKRELGVSYPTAWYMCHRIREALASNNNNEPTLKGIVEADETYVKGKGIPKGEKPKPGLGSQRLTPVIGLKERGGKVRANIRHEWVNHSIEYVVGDVHTNGIESFWSLFKRGVVGQYHRVSTKHLQRYLDKFCWRQNQDKDADMFDKILGQTVSDRHIKYSELTS